MPRKPRVEGAGVFHHAITCAPDGVRIVQDDVDRLSLIGMLAAAATAHSWRVHAYCVMDTHLHIVLDTAEPNLGVGMQRLLGTYARRFNDRWQRRGTVFVRPFWSRPIVGGEDFWNTCLYVVLNPVDAGLCDEPDEWWASSYVATAHGDESFICSDVILAGLGSDLEDARARYREATSARAGQILVSRQWSTGTAGVSPLG